MKTILAVWGGISAVILLCVIAFLAYQFTIGNSEKHNVATTKDVRFVLNWSELGEQRIEAVLYSYESSRSLTGDHLDAYAIKISHVSVHELENPKQDYINWTRGDNLSGALKQSVALISGFSKLNELGWFPHMDELTSEKFYVNYWSILLHDERPTAAQLIFANPYDNKIYYASVRT